MKNASKPYSYNAPECPHCGAQITIHQRFQPGHCGARPCAETHAVQGARKRRLEKRQEHEEELVRAAAALGELVGPEAAQAFQVATVPYQGAPLVPLPEARRSAFEKHLSRETAEAFDPEKPLLPSMYSTDSPQLPKSLLNASCATCRGKCCAAGAYQNAFITAKHISDLRMKDPDLTQQDVIDHYTNALPDMSTEDACVYQGNEGCVLSREWRAQVCNNYYCEAITEMTDRLVPEGEIALVAMEDEGAANFNVYTVATATLRPLSAPDPAKDQSVKP